MLYCVNCVPQDYYYRLFMLKTFLRIFGGEMIWELMITI
jgi:hypothetical protein